MNVATSYDSHSRNHGFPWGPVAPQILRILGAAFLDPLNLGGLHSSNALHLGGCASKPLRVGAAPKNHCNGFASALQFLILQYS